MMWLIWIPLLILIVVLIYKLLNNESSDFQKETPLEILRKRYARGEITEEEFRKKKQELDT